MDMWNFVMALVATLNGEPAPPAEAIVTEAATPGEVTDAEEYFIDGNLIMTFYHELGHAMFDILELPIYGEEEYAADVFSLVIVDRIFKEEFITGYAKATADGFIAKNLEYGDDPKDGSNYPTSLQRHYMIVCLIYGADSEGRGDFIDGFDIPDDWDRDCETEFNDAYNSWNRILDDIFVDEDAPPPDQPVFTLEVEGDSNSAEWLRIIAEAEIEYLNKFMRLPEVITVRIESCGTSNAYYHYDTNLIQLCSEQPAEYLYLYREHL